MNLRTLVFLVLSFLTAAFILVSLMLDHVCWVAGFMAAVLYVTALIWEVDDEQAP